MRMMMQAKFPLEPFNTHVRKGTAGALIGKILEALKPEAAYFVEWDGCRCGIFVVDVSDASRVPSVAEPFFLQLNAAVSFHICMTPDDLGKAGLDALGKKWA